MLTLAQIWHQKWHDMQISGSPGPIGHPYQISGHLTTCCKFGTSFYMKDPPLPISQC